MIFFTKREDTKYITSDVEEMSCGWGWGGGGVGGTAVLLKLLSLYF
jgi:hypothetical protein